VKQEESKGNVLRWNRNQLCSVHNPDSPSCVRLVLLVTQELMRNDGSAWEASSSCFYIIPCLSQSDLLYCRLLYSGFLLGFPFNLQDYGHMLLRNFDFQGTTWLPIPEDSRLVTPQKPIIAVALARHWIQFWAKWIQRIFIPYFKDPPFHDIQVIKLKDHWKKNIFQSTLCIRTESAMWSC
jgi:hypothetical protein